MDLVSALRISLRRWKVVVAVLIVTVIGAVAAYVTAPTVYSATNYVVVVPNSVTTLPGGPADPAATSSSDQAQRSALVSAGGARLLSSLLVTNLNGPQTRARLGDGPAATYSATADTQIPVVTVAVSGSDEQSVKALLGRVVDGADGVLGSLQTQAGIPASTAYRAPRFTPDPVVVAANPDRTKVVVAIVAAGIVLSILLAVALDGPLTRRRRRRELREDENETGIAVAGSPDGLLPVAEDGYSDLSPDRVGGEPTGAGPDRSAGQMPSNARVDSSAR